MPSYVKFMKNILAIKKKLGEFKTIALIEVCDIVKYNGVTNKAIRLRLFSFSLWDKANKWMNQELPNSITKCNDLD